MIETNINASDKITRGNSVEQKEKFKENKKRRNL